MKSILLMSATVLTVLLAVSIDAQARDVYPERSLGDIYALSTEGNRALIKARGAKKEFVTIGDVISEDRMTVVKINGLPSLLNRNTVTPRRGCRWAAGWGIRYLLR